MDEYLTPKITRHVGLECTPSETKAIRPTNETKRKKMIVKEKIGAYHIYAGEAFLISALCPSTNSPIFPISCLCTHHCYQWRKLTTLRPPSGFELSLQKVDGTRTVLLQRRQTLASLLDPCEKGLHILDQSLHVHRLPDALQDRLLVLNPPL